MRVHSVRIGGRVPIPDDAVTYGLRLRSQEWQRSKWPLSPASPPLSPREVSAPPASTPKGGTVALRSRFAHRHASGSTALRHEGPRPRPGLARK